MGIAGPTSCPWPTRKSLHFFLSSLVPSDSERIRCPINWRNYKGSCYCVFQRRTGRKQQVLAIEERRPRGYYSQEDR